MNGFFITYFTSMVKMFKPPYRKLVSQQRKMNSFDSRIFQFSTVWSCCIEFYCCFLKHELQNATHF